jgi:hypothetical protein
MYGVAKTYRAAEAVLYTFNAVAVVIRELRQCSKVAVYVADY